MPSLFTVQPPASTTRAGLAVITVAAFFMSADITMINVALPAIAAELHASVASLQWVVDAYNIVLAGLVLFGAGLGQRYGHKLAFLAGVGFFTLGSLLAGSAQGLSALVAGRVVMGVGGALLLAPALALIGQMFPPEARGKAVAAWAAGGALGMGAGPVVAGWRVLPHTAGQRGVPLDLPGAGLSVLGFALFLGALIEGPRLGWWHPGVWGAALAGALFIAGFVARELRCQHPMFDVRILLHPSVLAASLALFGSYIAYTGVLFLLAQQLHLLAGLGSVGIGVTLAGFAFVFWVGSRRAAGLAQRLGEASTLRLGMALMVCGFAVLALASWLGTAVWVQGLAVAGSLIAAAGVGLIVPRASVMILNALPASQAAAASAASMLARLLGAGVGIAVLGTALAMGLPQAPAHADPARFAQALVGAYGLGALLMLALALAMHAGLARSVSRECP